MHKKKLFIKAIKKNFLIKLGVLFCLILLIIVLFPQLIITHDIRVQSISNRYESPSSNHLLGTDGLGRDIFSRIIVGARSSLTVGAFSILIAMFFGVPLGIWSGYKGGIIDDIATRVIDIFMSIPSLILGLMIATALGPGVFNVIIAISIALFPRFARVARAPAISLRESSFVEASKAAGSNDMRILVKHIFPNIISDILVMATLWMATAIIIESSLSFLGLGIQPPTPSWGVMMKQGVDRIRIAPWMAIFPGLAIMFSCIAFNLVGDGVRDKLDPRIRDQY